MKVQLIQVTKNPIDVMWTAARTCYSAKSPVEMWDDLYNDEKVLECVAKHDITRAIDYSKEKEDKHWNLVKKVLDSGHNSISQHVYFTFAIEGVSRALTHQLVRHRLAVYSQQSQRYVEIKEDIGELCHLSLELKRDAKDKQDKTVATFEKTEKLLEKYFVIEHEIPETMQALLDDLITYKRYIEYGYKAEDARAVLPNCTKTNIVMSMDLGELMHVCNLRLCCFDDKTEILTTDGWKFFKDLKGDENFYSLNPITMSGEYAKSLNTFEYEYNGKMVNVESQSISLCTTPNHKMFCSYSYDNKKFILDECLNHDKHKRILMKKNCKEIQGELPLVYILKGFLREDANQYTQWQELMPDREVPIKEFLQFLGFYICDGCCIKQGQHYNIYISKEDKHKLEKYQKIIEKISPNKTKLFFDTYCWKLSFHDRYLYEYLSKLGKASEKYIPNELFKLDSTLLRYLFEGFLDGDINKGQNVFCTVSKQLSDDFQRLCLHVGYSATVSVYDRRDEEHLIKGRNNTTHIIKSNYPCYYVSINRAKNEPIIKTTNRNAFTEGNYKGHVYCVELEKNNIVYVRRNGRCVWSGNSRAQKEIRDLFKLIKQEVTEVDERLGSLLVPSCEVHNICFEAKCCGRKPTIEDVLRDAETVNELKKRVQDLQEKLDSSVVRTNTNEGSNG